MQGELASQLVVAGLVQAAGLDDVVLAADKRVLAIGGLDLIGSYRAGMLRRIVDRFEVFFWSGRSSGGSALSGSSGCGKSSMAAINTSSAMSGGGLFFILIT